jgi:hypothetical protein
METYMLDLKELNEEKPNGIKLLIEENVEVVRQTRSQMSSPTLVELRPRMRVVILLLWQ